MVEQNILENMKDPTDATLGGTDVARYEADQMADEDTKPANYIFCKTIPQIVGQKIPVGYPIILSPEVQAKKVHSTAKQKVRIVAQIDLDLFFT